MFCGDAESCRGKEENVLRSYFRALHCPARWKIVRIIGEEEKSTGEIFRELIEGNETLARSSLYYHLSELEKSGIIEHAAYREEGGGAPEKVWRLKTKEIRINLIEKKEEKQPPISEPTGI